MNFRLLMLLMAGIMLVSACKKDDDDDNGGDPTKNIVKIAMDDPDLSILVEALTKAELAATLQGPGPFTVFAPNNAAFEALFTTLGIGGIDDLSKEALTPILLYHVLATSVKSGDIQTGYFMTVNTSGPGSNHTSLFIEKSSNVRINAASTVTTADIEASNGVIHKVNAVILPLNVVGLALSNPDFSILVEALVAADLVDALNGTGPFTVFAPNNAAFEAILSDLGLDNVAQIPIDYLTDVLLYHVVSGNVRSADIVPGTVPTLNPDASLEISISGQDVMLNGSTKVTAVDIQGTNGVIHAIENVLLPGIK